MTHFPNGGFQNYIVIISYFVHWSLFDPDAINQDAMDLTKRIFRVNKIYEDDSIVQVLHLQG
jgi:hypothetical protein